jgi:hypothetical protein
VIIAVGGHSRNIGKTAVAEGIIRALPDMRWTAVKITQFGHGICSTGDSCECATGVDHTYALTRQAEPALNDSGRFLAAGAAESYWLRTRQGQLAEAMPALRRLLSSSENAILESTTVLHFLVPDLYIVVMDYAVDDMKDSTRHFLDRADALVVLHGDRPAPEAWNLPARWLTDKPRFEVKAPAFVSAELVKWIAGKAAASRRLSGVNDR